MLEVKGCIITIDAMGCQTKIAEKIVAKQTDYVLAVKDNQPLLHDAITDYFEVSIAANQPDLCQLQYQEKTDLGHGRIERGGVICRPAWTPYPMWQIGKGSKVLA